MPSPVLITAFVLVKNARPLPPVAFTLPGSPGFVAAAACTYIIYQARRGYNNTLVDALRDGRVRERQLAEKELSARLRRLLRG